MPYQQVSVELVRDGQCTPWGFRITGGADIGTPLVIQKVNFGSPSEGELQKGDVILQIRETDAARLSHQRASDLITKAGSTLKLVIARPTGGTLGYQAKISGTNTPPFRPLTSPTPGDSYMFKPLPTTNFPTQRQRRTSAESYASTASSDTEKEAIVNQPFRSSPLILPSAKITKDVPVGSYMRFDPLTKTSAPPSNLGLKGNNIFMLNKVQESLFEAAQTSTNSTRTPTPEMGHYNGPQVYLRQYNSPINMYSNQAVVEALMNQTSHIKKPQSPIMGKPLTDIKNSPTYQMIQDQEMGNMNKANLKEHKAVEEHVHNVIPGERTEIHQSGSFKTILNTLHGITEF